MDTSYTGLLPQSTEIVTDFAKEFRYILPASKTMCFKFQLKPGYQQVLIDMADTTPWQNAFIPTARCWPSSEPAGPSITSEPLQSQANLTLPPNGIKWLFWDITDSIAATTATSEPANIKKWIYPKNIYWMNIKNLQNRQSYFFCRFTYSGIGLTLIT